MGVLNAIWCALVKVINALIDWGLETITDTIAWVIALLPSLPFAIEPVEWGSFGHAIGYFIPVVDMIAHFSMLLACVLIWHSTGYIMRIVRFIK